MIRKIYDKLTSYSPQLRVGILCLVQVVMPESLSMASLILSAQIVILTNFIRNHYRERRSED